VTLWNNFFPQGTAVTVLGQVYEMPAKGESFTVLRRHASLMLRKNGKRNRILAHKPGEAPVAQPVYTPPPGYKLVPVEDETVEDPGGPPEVAEPVQAPVVPEVFEPVAEVEIEEEISEEVAELLADIEDEE
jgi:hypothetical protein